MRETKFRGRKINTNKWAVGDLGYTKTSSGNAGILVDGKLHIVDAETVGQYTGLKDKNGNEIYEGDLVEHEMEVNGEWELYEACEIVFDKECAMFCFKDDAPNILNYYRNLEVVGNIHINSK